ncbi:MAG: acylphosphatase [Deltaproteobacteria bacterium]|nr:acylphosphatase [Deltaproteobacteria bacterium]
MSTKMTRAHVMISGRVQGVFFRAETQEKARDLGLSGWVRNTQDGRVEAVFEGDGNAVEKMLQWCEKGSAGARVENVNVNYEKYVGEFQSFSVQH